MEYDEPTLRGVQEHFGLSSTGIVEKDVHIVRALAAIDPAPLAAGLRRRYPR
jgi:hypothetical protein